MSKARRFPVPLSVLACLLAVTVSLASAAAPAPPAGQGSSPDQAQDAAPQNQSSPDQSSPDQSSRDQSMETLKVNVDVVQLFFNVKDKKGGLIPSLTKDDFQLSEDGQPQTIKYFAAESDLPLTLGILIDTSASQTRVLGMEQEVGASFLNQILRDKDEAFVISFDVEVSLLQDFTNSNRLLRTALSSTKINSPPDNCSGLPGAGGGPLPCHGTPKGTLLYDGVYLASHDVLSKEVGRKAMILLTDGEDQGSQLKLRDAVESAQRSDSIVYVLLCADRGFYGFGGYSGDRDMKKLTEETGGRLIDVGNKVDKLRDAFDQIARELRSQYNIGYISTNRAKDGTFRKVEIRPKNTDYKTQARAGYYAVGKPD
jgi:VWFA-related protein